MQTPRFNKAIRYSASALIAYVLAYAACGTNGRYLSRVSSMRLDAEGHVVLAPNKTFEEWEPFPLYDEKSVMITFKHLIFYPLVRLDQRFLHPD